MGLWSRLKKENRTRRAKSARDKELAGDLGAAAELYLEAKMPDDAARVLLLRADAERSADKRIAFCALAARVAETPELRRRAAARKALLSFDVLVARAGPGLKSDMAAVARELEEAGELERAADAYAACGDADSEVRVLTAAGAIERLEERLRVSDAEARDQRELDTTLRTIADLDRTAERRAALAMARAWLGRHEDERVADAVRAIRARLARGPVALLELDGAAASYALGDEVTIGRGDATIVVASRAVSRRHVRVRRSETGPVVEDLETRNGTLLAGAKVAAPIPVGAGVELRLGGEIACAVRPASVDDHGGLLVIDVAGERYIAPLGPLQAGPWLIRHDPDEEGGFVVLSVPSGARPPALSGYELGRRVELCVGDELREARSGPVRLRVLAPGARSPRLGPPEGVTPEDAA